MPSSQLSRTARNSASVLSTSPRRERSNTSRAACADQPPTRSRTACRYCSAESGEICRTSSAWAVISAALSGSARTAARNPFSPMISGVRSMWASSFQAWKRGWRATVERQVAWPSSKYADAQAETRSVVSRSQSRPVSAEATEATVGTERTWPVPVPAWLRT